MVICKLIEIFEQIYSLELLLPYKTIVLWEKKLWYYEKNYGTMDKTMVLWTKLWYYTENNGTSIHEGKKHVRLPTTRNFIFNGKI